MSPETIETQADDSSSSTILEAFGILVLQVVHRNHRKCKPRWTNTSRTRLSRISQAGTLEDIALQGRHGLAKILRCSRSPPGAQLSKQYIPEASPYFPMYIQPLPLSPGRKRALLVSAKCVCKTEIYLKLCTRSESITKVNPMN